MDWRELGGLALYLLGAGFVTATIIGVLNYLFVFIAKRLGRASAITRSPWKTAIAWFVNFLILTPIFLLLLRLAELVLPEDKATYIAFAVIVVLILGWGKIESRLIRRWPHLRDWIKL